MYILSVIDSSESAHYSVGLQLGNMRKFLELILLPWLFSNVTANEVLDKFIVDIIEAWHLHLPTILVGDEMLEICWSQERVLCLSIGANASETAEHMARLHLHRKQDGVIFVGSDRSKNMVGHMNRLTPTIWTSNCPVFMPHDYSDIINLRLDTNILFYKVLEAQKYKLVDIFAVKDGSPISLNVGIWTNGSGITFQSRRNKWERRTDLKGTTLINSLDSYGLEAQLIKNDTGHIVDSTGFFQEKLFFITEGLNMKIKTKELPNEPFTMMENGSWTGAIGVLQRKEADVVSVSIGVLYERFPAMDYPIPTAFDSATLIAASPNGTSMNMWVYVEVFRPREWIIFFILLLILVMFMTIHSRSPDVTNALMNAMGTAYLFLIQLGSHSNINGLRPRFLTLTTSMLTFVMFVYYSTDITSKMTSGQSDIPIWSFEDVIHYDYKVIVSSAYHKGLLALAEKGTPKYSVYETYIENDRIRDHEEALTEIISNPKTLMYSDDVAMIGYPQAHNVIALKMDDSAYSWGAFGLQKDSEFLEVFNYYLLREFENGIKDRLYRKYYSDMYVNKQFGMREPQPLGYENVIFTFVCLAIGMTLSMVIAIIEYIAMKMGQNMSQYLAYQLDDEKSKTRSDIFG